MLVEAGFAQRKNDPASYVLWKTGTQPQASEKSQEFCKDERSHGQLSLHVDDMLGAGDAVFRKAWLKVLSQFQHSEEEWDEIMFCETSAPSGTRFA